MTSMTRRLIALFRALQGWLRRRRPDAPVGAAPRSYPMVPLAEHTGAGRPPRLHWKASHPATIRRFKAEVTCSRGHGIALRGHAVEADGRVVPSIVCREPGCDFHEIVRLAGWSAGRIPVAAGPEPGQAD